eukprot:13335996-Heterocapsa_arctica.AAC.1
MPEGVKGSPSGGGVSRRDDHGARKGGPPGRIWRDTANGKEKKRTPGMVDAQGWASVPSRSAACST